MDAPGDAEAVQANEVMKDLPGGVALTVSA